MLTNEEMTELKIKSENISGIKLMPKNFEATAVFEKD